MRRLKWKLFLLPLITLPAFAQDYGGETLAEKVSWQATDARGRLFQLASLADKPETKADFSRKIYNENIHPLYQSITETVNLALKGAEKRLLIDEFSKGQPHYDWLVKNWEPKFYLVVEAFKKFRTTYETVEKTLGVCGSTKVKIIVIEPKKDEKITAVAASAKKAQRLTKVILRLAENPDLKSSVDGGAWNSIRLQAALLQNIELLAEAPSPNIDKIDDIALQVWEECEQWENDFLLAPEKLSESFSNYHVEISKLVRLLEL